MNKSIIHLVLILTLSAPSIYAQVVMEADVLIVGGDSLPVNGEVITDTLMFYNKNKAALRGGRLSGLPKESAFWSPDSTGSSSISWGFNCLASGIGGASLGYACKSIGEYGPIAMGELTEANGDFGAIALGRSARANGDHGAIALGMGTIANGSYGATAMGFSTIANGHSCISAGLYNDPIVSAGYSITPTSPIFIIGNGNVNAPSNAMVVRKDGRVGIGSNAPNATVEVSADSGNAPTLELHEQSSTDYARLNFSNDSGPEAWTIAGRALATNSQRGARLNFFYSDTTGNVLSLFGDGNATLKGNLTQSSDLRLKKDLVPLTNVLSQLSQLSAYTYHWKQSADTQSQIGLIAQEVQRVYPELVREDEDGWLSVNYSKFVPILLEGIKEQAGQIQEQTDKITALQQMNAQILQRLEVLERNAK